MMLIVCDAVGLEERGLLIPPRFAVKLGDASYTMYLRHGLLLGAYSAAFTRLHSHGTIANAFTTFSATP
jgi:peptidoglycan/LPS O-acetylase OafA/YrhL